MTEDDQEPTAGEQQLHEPDEEGDVVDQTHLDEAAGPAAGEGPDAGAGDVLLGDDVPPPGKPRPV